MKTIRANKYSHLGNFRFRKVKNNYIITNDCGDWAILKQLNFERFLNNEIAEDEKIYKELSDKQFLQPSRKKLAEQATKYLKLNSSSYNKGTELFIIVLTLRCNHACLYCQTTPEKPDFQGVDMDESTAKKTLDLIFQAPATSFTIELQGGEPTLNWSILEYIVKYAKEMAKIKQKNVTFALVSNLTLLDDEKIHFLLENKVGISCSLDGPANIHDKNRPFLGKGGSHEKVIEKITLLNKKIKLKRSGSKDEFVDELNAITTITKVSMPFSKEIIDEYVRLGFQNIFLRPISPFGIAKKTYDIIGCSAKEFIPFYLKSLDYIIELNLNGTLFVERNAYYALLKIMNSSDPAFYELRNPCGATIGQMAYNYDGQVYTCDEGRMVVKMGYDNFKVGDVKNNRFNDLIDNEVTKTMCMASCLDNHGGCTDCAYKPYCGVCPLVHLVEYDTIFPNILSTDQCKIKMAMFDYLFTKIRIKKVKAVFEKWLEPLVLI